MAAPEAPLLYQGVARTSAAFRLLKQMGWQEGEGLGKEKQGIREHVRVSKKKDNSGLGIDAQQKAANNWTFNTTAFDSILKNLNVVVAKASQKDVGDNDENTETLANTSKYTKRLPSLKVTRPQGRYKKRELGKVLQGKSQADLDAILGYGSKPTKEVWPVPDVLKHTDVKSSLSKPSGVPSERLAEVDSTPATMKDKQLPEEMPAVNIASDWWGTKYGFVPAGALGQHKCDAEDKKMMGNLEATQSTKTRTSFCEQDQEDLYKLVQDKATKGRQGLGIADRPKKIGGAHWKGQKVVLGSSDNEEEEKGEVLDVQEMGTVDMVCERDECKRKLDSDEEDLRNGKRPRQDYKFKWKKLCRRLLQEAPAQTMKIKDLQRLIVDGSYLHTGWNLDGNQKPVNLCKEKLREKLVKSSRFVIEGKKVSLAISS